MGTPCLDPPLACPSKATWLRTTRCTVPNCGRVAISLGPDGAYYCEEHMLEIFGFIPAYV